jgi:hypothetical protein
MKEGVLFHVSEEPKIKIFYPRFSPGHLEVIQSEVVFALSGKMLHNYLLPRDCPRVCFYSAPNTQPSDIEKWMAPGNADFVIAVENKWFQAIQRTTLFIYEMPGQNFTLLDECAGYYISTLPVEPLSVRPIYNILEELLKRNIELRFVPSLQNLAKEVSSSSLNFSLIRMRNSIRI